MALELLSSSSRQQRHCQQDEAARHLVAQARRLGGGRNHAEEVRETNI